MKLKLGQKIVLILTLTQVAAFFTVLLYLGNTFANVLNRQTSDLSLNVQQVLTKPMIWACVIAASWIAVSVFFYIHSHNKRSKSSSEIPIFSGC